MKELDKVSLFDIMPESLAKDENIAATAKTIDPHLQNAAKENDKALLFSRLEGLPGPILGHLAESFSVSVYRDTWPENIKRQVIASSIQAARIKGTKQAVIDALSSFGAAAEILEWWQKEPKGSPHTFEVFISQQNMEGIAESEMTEDTISLIREAKPARSQFTFSIVQPFLGDVYFGGVCRTAVYARI